MANRLNSINKFLEKLSKEELLKIPPTPESEHPTPQTIEQLVKDFIQSMEIKKHGRTKQKRR
jgi:hypothetical protein